MRNLHIGIDGYNLAMPKGTGIATYGFNLARTLAGAGHRIEGVFGLDPGRDPRLRETLFFDRVGKDQTGRTVFGGRWHRRLRMAWASVYRGLEVTALEVPLSSHVDKDVFADTLPAFDRLTSTPGLFRLAQRHFNVTGRFLPLHVPNPPHIMHWTYPVPVRVSGSHNIYTIHDLVPLRLPYTTLGDKPRMFRLLDACAKWGDQICTVSEFSREDLIAQLGIEPDRVTNTYQSVLLPTSLLSEPFDTAARIVDATLGLKPRSYFLFFGAVEPKKNIGRLIEAYLGLQLDTPLVLVGARSWLSEGELALLPPDQSPAPHGELGTRRIIRLDYLSRDLLLRLIRTARGVLFPSIFEGFGLPALEAMQLGTPVLTSNRSSLPEIAGEAALLVDPYDIGSISDGIRRLDTDESLRDQLMMAGPVQAARFSPEPYLGRLEAMYTTVLDRPRRS